MSDNDALLWASRHGHVKILKFILLGSHDDLNFDNAIQLASQNGHVEIVKVLLADGRCNPVHLNNWCISIAAHHGFIEIVNVFLADPRVNPKGEDGIYIHNDLIYCCDIEIAVIDGVLCHVENGNVESIADEGLRAKFVKWQYRIGGHKHSLASNSIKS